MIDGQDYHRVMAVTGKAEHMGLVIVPPFFKESIIEPIKIKGDEDLFKVEINELRYPTIGHKIVHQGTFISVTMFIDGAFFIHESLRDLGLISEDEILTAAQHFILMENIRHSDKI